MNSIARLMLAVAAGFFAVTAPAFAGLPRAVPEPATMTLLAVGAGAVALVKFRRRK
jgi:hypothetical protein